MNVGVTLITPTGMRPQAFSFCRHFMRRQTWVGPMQWVVVNDGEDEVSTAGFPGIVSMIRPEPRWRPGQNTQARNLAAALSEAIYDKILFIEDDDYYSPDYVAVMAERLEQHTIVGETHAHYYHLPTRRFLILSNAHHASLCQTGMRADLIPLLRSICEGSRKEFIDIQLWEGAKDRGLYEGFHCVGIKGLPGRQGIGVGHNPDRLSGWTQDPNLHVLRSWVGDAVELYCPEAAQNTPKPFILKPLIAFPGNRL